MRTTLVITTTALTFLSFSSCAQESKLDGKTFFIKWYDANHPEEQVDDILVFDDGRMDCRGTHQWGFEAADYKCTENDREITFESTMVSATEGTTKWSGIVRGSHIEGEFYWPKEDMTFRFSGELKG